MNDSVQKKSKVDRIKDFLEKNKIFFEVGNILVAVVSLSTLFIAYRLSVQVSKTQEFFGKEQFLPRFQVENFGPNPSQPQDKYSDLINIYHVGGVYHDLHSDVATFLKLDFIDVKNKSKSICIPVNYFFCGFGKNYGSCDEEAKLSPFKKEEDRVFTWIDSGANSRLKTIHMLFSFIEYFKNRKDYKFSFLQPLKYLNLQYQDIFGSTNNEYYQFSQDIGSTGKFLDKDSGQNVFSAFKRMEKYSLDKITPEFVLNEIQKNKSDFDCEKI